MSDISELELLTKSGTPLLLIETREEERVIELFRRIAFRLEHPLHRWSISSGLLRVDTDGHEMRRHQKPVEVLQHIAGLTVDGLFLLLDFHPYLDDPVVVRLIREIAQRHQKAARTLILVGPRIELPDELLHHVARYELSMPDAPRLKELVIEEAGEWARRNAGAKVQVRAEVLEAITRNLAGLTGADARRLIRSAIFDDGRITAEDLERMMVEKYKLLDQGGVLSFEMDTAGLDDVAGLDNLKGWLERRKSTFLADQPIPGLDPPKGVLLLGVQGGGKSLAAKAVAGAWGVPLLRLDFGTLYNKYYGETERNLRESLKTASIMAPCVLWIDEIEKGLATDSDGGPSRRVLGTLLTWMAERKEAVFFVATANDIESLPPELLRKGRFDEIFFVDLPSREVRREIFRIHLARRDVPPENLDLEQLSDLSEGFTGAEIEQAVVSSLYTAHAEGKSLESEMLAKEITGTRPLSVVMAEQIAALRSWAKERTVPA